VGEKQAAACLTCEAIEVSGSLVPKPMNVGGPTTFAGLWGAGSATEF